MYTADLCYAQEDVPSCGDGNQHVCGLKCLKYYEAFSSTFVYRVKHSNAVSNVRRSVFILLGSFQIVYLALNLYGFSSIEMKHYFQLMK